MKLAIIGAGTAGCFSVTHFLKYTNWEINWYLDPNTKPQAVGEGSNLILPIALYNNIGFNAIDLNNIDGTFKIGLKKQNWGSKESTFYHLFTPGNVGYHFNAVKLQLYLQNKVKSIGSRIKIIEERVDNTDKIDCDFILDCSGKPSNLENFYKAESIPVNSVYVTQCFWEYSRFDYTLTIARPYGWVFGIPLKNRCAIGYMYNNSINTLDEVKSDVSNIFSEYNLVPSDQTNAFSFNNYYKKQNYSKRIAYNGNASFFLEPLEATSIHFMDMCNRLAFDSYNGNMSIEAANLQYLQKIREIENVISLHYLAGSLWKNEFWEKAYKKARINIDLAKENSKFNEIISLALKYNSSMPKLEYGTWDLSSFPININALNLWDQVVST